ncbi:MAG TPA: hypothetical protein VEI55_05115 [Candidatus Acidoferrum sp.]|nr:hypothetical protein [Candidatus Acidoferrum sp.]
MMKLSFATVAILSLGLALGGASGRWQNQPDRAWTDKHFLTAFEDFFPIRNGEGDFIAVRAHQNGSNQALEFSFVIEDTQDPHAIGSTLREAQGASLYQQLQALHQRDPSKSYADLKPQLKVQTRSLTVADCPAILAQFTAFQNIQFVRPRDDEVGENPILYEINETVGGASSQVIEFVASRAIPHWANQTRKALLACTASPQGEGTKKDD